MNQKRGQNKFRAMTVPQPFQHQGGQRARAPLILYPVFDSAGVSIL
jgi:hypothetical protein